MVFMTMGFACEEKREQHEREKEEREKKIELMRRRERERERGERKRITNINKKGRHNKRTLFKDTILLQ